MKWNKTQDVTNGGRPPGQGKRTRSSNRTQCKENRKEPRKKRREQKKGGEWRRHSKRTNTNRGYRNRCLHVMGERRQGIREGGKSAGADGVPRSLVCTRLTLHSAPHQHQRKYFGAHDCKVVFKHLHQPLRSHTPIFKTLGQLLEIPPFFRPNEA
jgi:hypothetical protein